MALVCEQGFVGDLHGWCPGAVVAATRRDRGQDRSFITVDTRDVLAIQP
jgi:hypothetical protein